MRDFVNRFKARFRQTPPRALPSPAAQRQTQAIRPSLVRLAAIGVGIVLLIAGALAYTIYQRHMRSLAWTASATAAGADATDILRGAPRGGEIKPASFHIAPMVTPPKIQTRPTRQDSGENGALEYVKEAWKTYYKRLAALDEYRYQQYLKAMRDPDTRIAVGSGGSPASAPAPSTSPLSALSGLPGFGGMPMDGLPGMGGIGQQPFDYRSGEIDPAAAQKERWLAHGRQGADMEQTARKDPPSPFTVIATTFIPSSLVTAMGSDSPGPFVGQVNQDIYNYSGSCVEIPYGSKLLGDYDAQVSMGQSKIPVRVYRVIYPDGSSANVGNSAPAADQNGEAGLGGSVNRHVLERLVNGIIIGISGVAAQSVSGLPYGSAFVTGPQQAINSAAYWGLSIPPTIEPPAGKRFTLIVTKDWVLRPWSCDGRRLGPQLPIMTEAK